MTNFKPNDKHAQVFSSLPEEVRVELTSCGPGWAQVKPGEWRLLPSCIDPTTYAKQGWVPADPTAILTLAPAKPNTGWELGLDFEQDGDKTISIYYASRTEIDDWSKRKKNGVSAYTDDIWLAALQFLSKAHKK